jgi:hypothetical protein
MESTAKIIGTASIWLAFTITLTAGVCKMNWNGDSAEITFIITVATISSAAVVSTGFIWFGRSISLKQQPYAQHSS